MLFHDMFDSSSFVICTTTKDHLLKVKINLLLYFFVMLL